MHGSAPPKGWRTVLLLLLIVAVCAGLVLRGVRSSPLALRVLGAAWAGFRAGARRAAGARRGAQTAPRSFTIEERTFVNGAPYRVVKYFVSPKGARSEHYDAAGHLLSIRLVAQGGRYVLDPSGEDYARDGDAAMGRLLDIHYRRIETLGALWRAGRETVKGQDCDKLKTADGLLWVSRLTSLPVLETWSHANVTPPMAWRAEWSRYEPGEQPDALFELPRGALDADKPDTSLLQFAYSDSSGKRLLAKELGLHWGEPVKVREPERLTRALCPGNLLLPVKHLRHQYWDPRKDRGQGLPADFDSLPGEVFQVEEDRPWKGPAPCLLVPDSYLRSRRVVPFEAARGDKEVCGEAVRALIASAGRQLSACWGLARLPGGDALLGATFEGGDSAQAGGGARLLVKTGRLAVEHHTLDEDRTWPAPAPDEEVSFVLQQEGSGRYEIGVIHASTGTQWAGLFLSGGRRLALIKDASQPDGPLLSSDELETQRVPLPPGAPRLLDLLEAQGASSSKGLAAAVRVPLKVRQTWYLDGSCNAECREFEIEDAGSASEALGVLAGVWARDKWRQAGFRHLGGGRFGTVYWGDCPHEFSVTFDGSGDRVASVDLDRGETAWLSRSGPSSECR